jgi:hypothetical protein
MSMGAFCPVEMSFLLSELLLLIAIITYFVHVINPI